MLQTDVVVPPHSVALLGLPRTEATAQHFPFLKSCIPSKVPFGVLGFLFVCLFFNLFIYLFMAVLGLHFCARAFSSCGKWGPLFIAVRGPLIIAAFLVVEHRLQTRRLSNCGSRAQSLRGMWDPPRPGHQGSPGVLGFDRGHLTRPQMGLGPSHKMAP